MKSKIFSLPRQQRRQSCLWRLFCLKQLTISPFIDILLDPRLKYLRRIMKLKFDSGLEYQLDVTFVSADQRLPKIAAEEGLKTLTR